MLLDTIDIKVLIDKSLNVINELEILGFSPGHLPFW